MTKQAFVGLAAFALLLVLQVLARPLLPIDETRYLAVAWEMHLSGDIFHLTRNFEPYSHKPPLLFWLINLVWLVTGVSEGSGRLIGPAFAVLAVAATQLLAGRFWPDDRGAPMRATMILAGFTLFAVFGSLTMFDALLTVIVLGGIAVIWRIGQGQVARQSWLLLGLAFGLGVLAKGPVVLLHLLPVLLAIRLWAPMPPDWRVLAKGIGVALGVGLAVACVWLLPALILGDAAFRTDLLWTQSAARVAGTMGHGRPFWFLIGLIPLILFPWGWSWRLWRGVPDAVRGDPASRMCLIWAGSALLIFSVVGGKQLHYLLPELAAMALLLAHVAGRVTERRGGSAGFVPVLVLGLAALVVASGVMGRAGALADLVPGGAVAGFGLVCLGLAAAAVRLPLMQAHLVLGVGLSGALHGVVLMTSLDDTLDTTPIGRALAAHQDQGMAVTGFSYNADFNFTGRLTRPVATPADLPAWAAQHPGGLIVGPVARAGITAPPAQVWRFRGTEYGAWPADALVIFRE